MKIRMEFYDFRRIIMEHRPDNFTIEGLVALWRHLEEQEAEFNEEMDFNLSDICSTYSEYESPAEYFEECQGSYDHVLVAQTETGGCIVRNS